MKVAAIISEYNPFHYGHLYQVNKIRDILGEDTAIVAVMSGNFTQRGEIAIADKTVRAEAAVRAGVNLVLEIPFPFCMSSAEIYAKSGVKIADSIGVVDYLVFGSELGNIDELKRIASNMLSPELSMEIGKIQKEADGREIGYPKASELAYKRLFPNENTDGIFSPNNILALEYIKALMEKNSKIEPLTIKREGAGYTSPLIPESNIQSASAIRETLRKDLNSAMDYIPNSAKEAFLEAEKAGKFPTDERRLDTAVISILRLNSPDRIENIHDTAGGLYNRLYDLSHKTATISQLVNTAETKKFTKSRIRRAIYYSCFGVTSSEVTALPSYTQVLALDGVGRKLLREIGKMTDIPVITKPSDYSGLGEDVISQKELSHRADSVFLLSQSVPSQKRFYLTFTPYVKK
ncbi:MAG: nucleotidyltransferase family protein [Clostridia bacterium]|nr:nucleotidyltransferase family protein [Clostridia bacterium]